MPAVRDFRYESPPMDRLTALLLQLQLEWTPSGKKEQMNKTEISQLFSAASHQIQAAAHLMEVGRTEEARASAHRGIASATFALEMGKGRCVHCCGTGFLVGGGIGGACRACAGSGKERAL